MTETETEEVIDAEIEEEVRNLPAVRASEAIITRAELTVDEVVAQKDKIEQVMQRVMKRNVHYGVIPGVNKPSLFKAGAEAINVALRLAPHYESEKIWHDDGHLTVITKCELHHIPTGLVVGTGEGLCTTRESRYAFRNAKRVCPACGAEAIIKGKAEYGGGYVCWKKEGGCGAKFEDGDPVIEDQEQGKVPNPDLADAFNTVLKMAAKRSLTAAVLNATAASDIFTMDVEDQPVAASGADSQTDNQPEPEAEKKEFDPGRDLLENAIQGASKESVERLEATLNRLNDLVDWKATIGWATVAHFGKDRAKLSKAQRDEWWIRLRNAAAKLEEIADPDLGASPEAVAHTLAFAFSQQEGLTEVTMLPRDKPKPEDTPSLDVEMSEADEAIPFGDE